MRLLILLIGICTFFTNCQQVKQKKLVGEWQAAELLEENRRLPVDVRQIKLLFTTENDYQYQSTLNYREAGSYYINEKHLFTIDTVNQASTEKAVEITKLTQDSLYLRMVDNGKNRLLKMYRVTTPQVIPVKEVR